MISHKKYYLCHIAQGKQEKHSRVTVAALALSTLGDTTQKELILFVLNQWGGQMAHATMAHAIMPVRHNGAFYYKMA